MARSILTLGTLIERIFSVMTPKFVRIMSTTIYVRVAEIGWITDYLNVATTKQERRLIHVPGLIGLACSTSYPKSDEKSTGLEVEISC